jgi:peptidoglycan/LPS O-acetylase OafA/YrhL
MRSLSQSIERPRQSEPALPERTFRPDIEGLRAVAVLAVVLFHAGVPGIRGGYVGVDVFFVLSGLLITGLLLREQQRRGSVSLPAFYARRARRILPAATFVLIATVLATYYWLGHIRGSATALDGRWTAAFAANLRFALQGTDYFGRQIAPSPLRHYWSLAVEEQFYLVWPALLLLTATVARGVALRPKLVAVLAVIVIGSFTWSVVETRTDPVWAFFSPLTRAWELGIGALVALGTTRLRLLPDRLAPWLSWAGLLVVLLSLVLLTERTAFPGYAAALPILGTALVIIGGTIRPACGAELVLGRAPLQWLGKVSYSWYLTHWPVLIIAGALATAPLSVGANLALSAAALLLAVIMYRLIENPIRYARPLAANSVRSLALGAGAVAVTFGVCAWMPQGRTAATGAMSPQAPAESTDEVLALVAAAAQIRTLPENVRPPLEDAVRDFPVSAGSDPSTGELQRQGCSQGQDVQRIGPCVFGDPAGSRTLVLFGDSHVAMWFSAFDLMGKRLHWKIVLLEKSACSAPATSITRAETSNGTVAVPYPECVRWRQAAIIRINQLRPDLVVISDDTNNIAPDGRPLAPAEWSAGLEATLAQISVPNSAKLILGDIPHMSQSSPQNCLAQHAHDVQACSTPRAAAMEAEHGDVERQVAAVTGARYLDVTPWLCSSVCTAIVGDMDVYLNQDHITATYATYLTGAVEAAVAPLLLGTASPAPAIAPVTP